MWESEDELVQAAIQWLKSEGFCTALDTSNNYLALGRAPDISFLDKNGNLCLVEAKLKNQKQAFKQSYDHLLVADFCYVLFPKNINQEMFVEHNIGIIKGEKDNGFKILAEAKPSKWTFEHAKQDYIKRYWPECK